MRGPSVNSVDSASPQACHRRQALEHLSTATQVLRATQSPLMTT